MFCPHVYMHHMPAWCWRNSEEGFRAPGFGIVGGCKPPAVGARNRALVFCKSNK